MSADPDWTPWERYLLHVALSLLLVPVGLYLASLHIVRVCRRFLRSWQ